MSSSPERPRVQHAVPQEVIWRRRRRVRGDRPVSVSFKGAEIIELDQLARHFGFTGRSARQDVIRALVKSAHLHMEAAGG